MEKTVITNETRIADILQAHPETADVFSSHGLGCFVCMGASMETIEEGALMHGLDVDVIVKELNKVISG
jgi:hybrid cluster-associated redox disulfide protein